MRAERRRHAALAVPPPAKTQQVACSEEPGAATVRLFVIINVALIPYDVYRCLTGAQQPAHMTAAPTQLRRACRAGARCRPSSPLFPSAAPLVLAPPSSLHQRSKRKGQDNTAPNRRAGLLHSNPPALASHSKPLALAVPLLAAQQQP